MPRKIAFVDDEVEILRALKRLFHTTEYECTYFNKAADFIHYLEQNSVDLLITDIRMPETDGIELMKRVKEIRPEIIRVALSGYTDSRQILAALDSGLARLYIYKPWDNDELINLIEGLIGLMRKLKNSELTHSINNLGSLPTLPKIYQSVVNAIENDAGASEISRIIETDPAITAKLLRIANTAYYGSRTGTVQQAITLLGLSNIRQIILSNAVFDKCEHLPFIKDIWQHAAYTNKGVIYLHQLLYGKTIPAHAGVVGLMHSIGLLFIASANVTLYLQIIDELTQSTSEIAKDNLTCIERKLIGFSHSEIGSYLLNWWELPFDIIESAYAYRAPQMEGLTNTNITALVHVASHFAYSTLDLKLFQFEIDENLLNLVGIKPVHIQALVSFYDHLHLSDEV